MHLSIYLSNYLSIYLFIYLSIYLPIYLSIYLSTYLPISITLAEKPRASLTCFYFYMFPIAGVVAVVHIPLSWPPKDVRFAVRSCQLAPIFA